MSNSERQYIAIDLKSFYASVECVERGLDPLDTNLVVADKSRTDKTICLAVSPSLKAIGVPGRPRLFEVVHLVKQANDRRRTAAPNAWFAGKSASQRILAKHPELGIDYIIAPPRMAHYIKYSTDIYRIYLKYVAPEDIHVYSIDEVFIDITDYLKMARMTAHEMAMTIIRDVLKNTGITATAGIGTNLYLCKVAMDIVAKRMPPDEDGVRIAELNEATYRRTLWCHEPLTDFWRVGHGTQQRLNMLGIRTMGDIARASLKNETLLFSIFGVNAELLIDHAWGWEPCTMAMIKAYRPTTNSLCNGQVLTCAYTSKKALVVVKEMAEALAHDLVEKRLVTDQLVLTVGYDVENLTNPEIRSRYSGPTRFDHYGREVPVHSHGTENLKRPTWSARQLREAVARLFERIVNPTLLVRRLSVTANRVVREEDALTRMSSVQLELFADPSLQPDPLNEQQALKKERRLMEAAIALKRRFGKNALLKGLDYDEGATARERNNQIGGHKA